MDRYLIPAQTTRAEIQVLNSRFIATLAPVFSMDEAKLFIQDIRREFSDATHHVPAYIIGHGPSTINHCSDDGEPAGTAGRPALAVLSGSGLGDAAVVVTRYFGGTKLGTGGLVRAYSDAVRQVISMTPRAEKVLTHTVIIDIPYNWFDRLQVIIKSHGGQVTDQEFAAQVIITAVFPAERFPDFHFTLQEASHGTLHPEIVETKLAIIPTGGM